MWMYGLQICYMYHVHAVMRADTKRLEEVSDPLKLELQRVVTRHVGAWNPTQDLWLGARAPSHWAAPQLLSILETGSFAEPAGPELLWCPALWLWTCYHTHLLLGFLVPAQQALSWSTSAVPAMTSSELNYIYKDSMSGWVISTEWRWDRTLACLLEVTGQSE